MRSDLIIEKAFEALDEYGYTKEEMMYYDQLERNEDVYKTLLSDYKAAGLKEGEKAKAIEIAKNLKKLGMGTLEIQQATGLSTNELLKNI